MQYGYFTMTGGVINGNTAYIRGGGVDAYYYGNTLFGGTAIVCNNTTLGINDNTVVAGFIVLGIGTFAPVDGMEVWVRTVSANGVIVEGGASPIDALFFRADESGKTVEYENGQLIIREPTPPSISTSSLPDGIVGAVYNQTLTATGSAPITWSVDNGSLPDGLSLSTDGVISGTPTVLNTYTFTVKAENGEGYNTQEITITINEKTITISGEVRSYNPNNATTITLYEAGSTTEIVATTIIEATSGSGQETQGFALEGVPEGLYDLVVTKGGHLTYKITNISIADEDIDFKAATTKAYSTIVLLAGDITGSGQISTPDLTILLNSFGSAPTALNQYADITGSGTVSTPDLTVLLNNFGKNNNNTTIQY